MIKVLTDSETFYINASLEDAERIFCSKGDEFVKMCSLTKGIVYIRKSKINSFHEAKE